MFKFLPPKSRSRSQSAILAMTPFHGKCENLQMSLLHFYARSYHFSDIKCLSFYLQKVGQGHRVQFSRLHLPSNGGCAKILLRDFDILSEYQKCKIVRCRKQ